MIESVKCTIIGIQASRLGESCNRQYGARFVSVMPTNLYSSNDNYDLANSHVLRALIIVPPYWALEIFSCGSTESVRCGGRVISKDRVFRYHASNERAS
jgi:predicted neuraminidase